ncbi:MAG: ABC transporter permease [Clostridia bacterium]|nr:ABC transporter permease [Clostridia bacterium]
MKKKLVSLIDSPGFLSAMSSISAIVLGLLFGFLILLISNPGQAVQGLGIILQGGFSGGAKGIGQVLYLATPIIMTGLAVGFAFKTGLFNIGTPGQFIVGAYVAIYIGVKWTFLGGVQWIVALLGATVAGGLWALIPGILKAYLNVHEVIASIMMNYIGMYTVNMLIKRTVYNSLKNQSMNVAATAEIPRFGMDKVFVNVKGNLMDTSTVNGGFFIAIAAAVVIYILLNKTKFGYELKACGANRFASRYAGINEKRTIVLSMVISGMLAGLGGGLLYLSGANGRHISVIDVLAEEGFNGISVALLGLNNPIGIVFSALFIAYITLGGNYLQRLAFMPEVINIIIAVIIYFAALSLVVRQVIMYLRRRREQRAAVKAAASEGGAQE